MTMAPLLGRLLLLTCGGFLLVHHTGAVIELTDQNFYDYAKDREVLLVDFFAPWCGDCKALDPDLENAATSLGTRSIDLAKVDCFGAGKGLCSTYGVKRWPTLKNFNRGQYTGDYTGGLSTAELAGYITTVENSVNPVNPVVNPYAAPFMPVAAAAVTQQCVSRCKISRITNKTPCYARCKGPKPLGRKVLPQPVINEKSCAKCRQPQIAGKFSSYCSAIEEGCRRLNEVEHAELLPKHPQILVNATTAEVGVSGLLRQTPEVGVSSLLKQTAGVGVSSLLKQTAEVGLSSLLKQTAEVGASGLPKQTEHIMSEFINKPNIVTDFIRHKKHNFGVPKLTKQAPYEDNDSQYEKVAGENTFMQKASISHGHKRRNKFMDSLTPNEALTVPYDNGDKKQKVAQDLMVPREAPTVPYNNGNKKQMVALDSMAPREAPTVPYNNVNKKQNVAQTQKVYKSRISLNNVHVDGVSIFSAIA